MCLAPFSGCWPQVAAVYICVCPNLTLLDTIFHGWELQEFRDCMAATTNIQLQQEIETQNESQIPPENPERQTSETSKFRRGVFSFLLERLL